MITQANILFNFIKATVPQITPSRVVQVKLSSS